MNTAARKKTRRGGPSVLRFKVRLVQRGAKTAFDLPKDVREKLRGMDTIEGTINGHPFRAALERDASGLCTVRANKAMLNGADAGPGGTVNLAILGPEPELEIPADLHRVLTGSAKALWADLTPLGRRDWVRWIEGAKTPETRARRIRRTVEQLSSGKRRPCCVNVYEFMLSHIQ